MRRDPASLYWWAAFSVGALLVVSGLGAFLFKPEKPIAGYDMIGCGLLSFGGVLALVAVGGLVHVWWELRHGAKKDDLDAWSPPPRQFTAAEAAEMIRKLRRYSPAQIDVWWIAKDLEAQRFAMEIARLLQAAGWNVYQTQEGGNIVPRQPGISILHDKSQPNQSIVMLADLLRSLGHAVTEEQWKKPDYSARVFVQESER